MTKQETREVYKTVHDQTVQIKKLEKALDKVCNYLKDMNMTNDCVKDCPLRYMCQQDIEKELPCQNAWEWKKWSMQ